MQAQRVNKHIVQWLKEYAEKARVNGFVVGVSGGIDSAVTATLCAQTGMKVLLLEMPIHQAENQVSRANELIDSLKEKYPNVVSEKVDLTPVYEQLLQQVKEREQDKTDLSKANTRSRLRMVTLYYHAGIYGLLVTGTGNKVEDFGVGFYTKYGDGGVDISPIADLMKSEVYKLGAFLKVPLSILKAAPTDGLFGDNRTDEEQIGASYDELEWAMDYEAGKFGKKELSERQKKVLEIYRNRHNANKHKMLPIPVCEIPENIK
jgi:NAD+ synthase